MNRIVFLKKASLFTLLLLLCSVAYTYAQNLYAIDNYGDWDDGTTWSTSSGGSTCNCIPNGNTNVHIGESGSIRVYIDDDQTARNVTIYNGGELMWDRSVDLFIQNGGQIDVQLGGNLNRNGRTSRIYFSDNTDGSIIVNGDFSAEYVYLNSNNTYTISGNGYMYINNDFYISGDATVTNSHTNFRVNDMMYIAGQASFTNSGTLYIVDEIEITGNNSTVLNTGSITMDDLLDFQANDVTFTNSGTLNISNDIYFGNNRCTLVNNGTITLDDDIRAANNTYDNIITNNSTGTFTISSIINITNSYRFVINNYGTFNLGGELRSPTGGNATRWYNYAGSTANLYDDDFDSNNQLLLYASYNSNLINYSRNGSQDIATPQDGYYNLTLSGTGIKETQDDLNINGDLIISGSSALNPDTNNDDITIAGNWTNTSTNSDAFDQGTETVTFNGSSPQTITNASGETFYDLVFDNSAGFTGNGDISVTGTLSMTDGDIDMGTNTITLGNSTANEGIFDYTSGTIIGKFERWIANSSTSSYTFPVGTSSNLNTVEIDLLTAASAGGSLIVEYIGSDPGNAGLPVLDGTSSVASAFSDGYWTLTPANGFTNNDFDLTLDGTGMVSNTIDENTRIITRASSGDNWTVEGTHLPAAAPIVYRSGMTTLPAECGLGSGAAPPPPTTWYTYGGGGDWNDPTTWTLDGTGALFDNPGNNIPSTLDYVEILSGATVLMDLNNVTIASLNIAGELYLGTTSGHDFSIISGNGLIYLQGSAGFDNFPDGVTSLFADPVVGGTVIYTGTGLTMNQQREFNNFILNLTNDTDDLILLNDLTLNGDFTITNGNFQINNNTSTTILNLTVNGNTLVDSNGSISVGRGNTIGTYSITWSNMPSTGNYHNIYHQVIFGGDFTNNGTVRFTNELSPIYNEFSVIGAATVRFVGNSNNLVSLFGTTDFYNLIINKGNDQTYHLEITSDNINNFSLFGPNNVGRVENVPFSAANPEVRKALWIYNGTLHLTGYISIPTLSEGDRISGNGDFPIGQNGALWIDGEHVEVYSTADNATEVPSGSTGVNTGSSHQALSVYGTFRISDGYFGTRGSAGFIFWNAAAGNVEIEGGTVNVSQFRSAGGGTGTNSYIQSGGTVIVRSNSGVAGEVSNTYSLFSLHLSDAVFNMSGGTLRIYGERGGGTVFINSDPGYYSVTGGTVIVENTTGSNAIIASKAPFWNLTVNNNGGTAAQIDLITQSSGGETIVNPDLIIRNNFTIGSGVTFDHNGNNVEVGSDFIIQNGGDYLYDASKPNTTTLNGVDHCLFAFYNRTGGVDDEQRFWNLVIDKPSNKNVTLASGKSNLTGNNNNLLRIDGDYLKLLSGTLDQDAYSIRLYADTLVNYDELTLFDIDVTDESDAHGRNDLLKFRDDGGDATILITADTSRFGAVKQNSDDKIMTLNTDLKVGYLLYKHGRMNLQDNNLTIDVLDASPNQNADNGTCNNCFSVSDMFILDGNSSDGGLSIFIPSDGLNPVDGTSTFLFPFGIGQDGSDATGTISKYTPAEVTISNPVDSGYITIRPVDRILATTNPVGDVLSYYWRVNYSVFTTGDEPDVEYLFKYYDADLDGSGNEASFVPGKVLDEGTFTRSYEVASNINTTTNLITFNGNTSGTPSPFTLENANYTAGETTRFTGNVEVYYSKGIRDAANSNWRTPSYWTMGNNPTYDPHDSRQANATDYPQAGDIAIVGWVPWGDPAGNEGMPHGMEIDGNETFAELRFSQMLDNSDNPVERQFYSNFQFRPTVCINPGGVINAQTVRGEGAFWLRSTGTNQVDPDFSNIDMGDFAREDSAYMIYESTRTTFVYNNIPEEVPNLLVSSDSWGGVDLDFEISTDVHVMENFELLGNTNLVLSSGATGDLIIDGNLKMFELNGGGGEITFPNNASRSIEISGDLNLINQNALIHIRNANNTVNVSELTVHGNIIQDNNSATNGLFLSSGAGLDYINLTLSGEGDHSFDIISGEDARLYSITIDKGRDQSSSFTFNGNFTLDGPTSGVGVTKAFNLENGIAVINNSSINIDLNTGDDDFIIPSSAGLQVSQGQVNVSGDDTGIELDGSLIIDGGIVNMDDPANNGNNYIEYTASGDARIDISSGSLLVGSQIRGNLVTTSSVLDYTQTGGTVEVGINNAPEASRGVFEIYNTGSNFTYTGGSLTLVRQNTSSPGVAALRLLPTTSDVTQTIFIGNSDTPASQDDFGVNSNISLSGLTITGGPAFPTAVVKVNPLTIGTLTIDAGAEFDCNGIDVTIEGDLDNDGTFTPNGNNTTFHSGSTQQITGTGTTDFYDLTKTGSGILITELSFTVNNDLTISEGTFDDNSHTIDLLGDAIIDAIHQSTGNAGDGLRFIGPASQELRRSEYGTGTLGIVTLQNPNGVIIPEGNGYDFNIEGNLQMNGGVFNIGSSSVTLGTGSEVTSSTAYSVSNMVRTNSSFTDNGLGKTFPTGYNSSFTFPVGETSYTPVVIDFSVSGGTSGTSVGSIHVRPANEYHPTVDDGSDVVAGGDINNVLQYYWTLNSSNINNLVADVLFYYDQSDVLLAGGGAESDYIPARILSFNNPSYNINKFDASNINVTTNEISFGYLDVFNGVSSAGISGDYFAGIDEAIPDNVATYIVQGVGGEVEDPVYDQPVPGGGAPKGAVIIIPSGATLTFTIDNVSLYKTEIQDGGELEINDSEFHRLGIVEGIGNLKIVHNASGNPTMPAADFGSFLSCSGGSLEYAGTGSYNILGGIPNIRQLTLSGIGDRNFPNMDVNICENFYVDGPTIIIQFNRRTVIRNDVYLNAGTINAPSGSNGRFNVYNNFENNGGIYNGGSSGITHVVGDLIINSGTINVGSSNYIFRIFRGIENNGAFNGGSGNSTFVFFSNSIYSTNSTISGNFTGTNAFHNILLYKQLNNYVTQNTDIEITNNLTFTYGILNTNGNSVILSSSATATPSNGLPNSYINGRVVKNISTAGGSFTFPIGSANRWRPGSVQNVSVGGLDWEMEYFEESAITTPEVTNMTPASATIETVSTMEYWRVTDGNAAPSGVTATIGLSWGDDSYVSAIPAEREQLEVLAWNGSAWDNYGGTNFSGGHTQASGSFTSNSAVSFSEKIITLGSSDGANPLPVELVSFSGKKNEREVDLFWATASELNNDKFIVEHSLNGTTFNPIGEVLGAGTTNVTQNYQFTHDNPSFPDNYYRLKQVDFDGSVQYSNVILIKMNKEVLISSDPDFKLYPNPTPDSDVDIELFSIDYSKPLMIEMISLSGHTILKREYGIGEYDSVINLEFGYSVNPGIYIVRIIQSGPPMVKKLVVNYK